MKRFLLTGALAIFTCCSLIGLAEDGAKTTAKPAQTDKADKAEKVDKTEKKGRLPSNYGKLGLTEPQKQKIYGIQAKYDDQLDSLEKQMDALKAKRDHEVETTLNDDQKKILKNLVDASKDSKKPKGASADGEKSGSTDGKTEKK